MFGSANAVSEQASRRSVLRALFRRLPRWCRMLDALFLMPSSQSEVLLVTLIIAGLGILWVCNRRTATLRPTTSVRRTAVAQVQRPALPPSSSASSLTLVSANTFLTLAPSDTSATAAAAAVHRPPLAASSRDGSVHVHVSSDGMVALLALLGLGRRVAIIVGNSTPAAVEPVLAALKQGGAFASGLRPHEVLFAGTPEGKRAVVRQLLPAVYIDDDADTADYIAPHIPTTVLVAEETLLKGRNSAKVKVVPSLVTYVQSLS
eukprot:TRINITY_DN59630_c0_g1_i1.p1 TRINITY_DN59630_c0_g1~~TRINITY_DN59630_c0_g1_i1.p1  ORF type:complete len:262 (+),score=25.03 TRINITY_DN59630_c0_g1_i1:72-857(+)